MGKRLYLDNDWFFNEAFEEGMLMPDYDFENNEKIRLPHTVKETPLHYFDEHEYQKEAAYFKSLYIPAEWEGKDILLTFEGVLHSCVVYVNGNAAASHECGYTAFRVRLNSWVKYGEDNIITVKADSREDQNIPPFGFVIDYMTYGGIYRDVYLEVKDTAHLDDVFVSGDMNGNIRLEVSATKEAQDMKLESYVIALAKTGEGYSEGEAVPFVSTVYSRVNERKETVIEEKVSDFRRWSTKHPNLYLMRVILKNENDEILDS
ncbi:MAG: glycoside hydrolase family 2 protein, partial [Lachnospiraceae bacterium]|nr:glycoside hydrolase family 2 protein [Lachnospiraceae bacterium]